MDLKVRNIDDVTGARLKEIAASKGIGVETLVRKLLVDFTLSPEIRAIEDSYISLIQDITGLYQSLLADTNRALQENSYIIEKVIGLLEVDDE